MPGMNLVMRNGEIVHFEAVGNRGVDYSANVTGRPSVFTHDEANNVVAAML